MIDPVFLFTIVNTLVMPFWLLLLVAPGWIWTQRLVHSGLIPILLGSVYVVGVLAAPPGPEGASMGSLDGVMLLFSTPEWVLVGWVHYLVFDLFVGAWIARDALRRGIHKLAVAPCLFFTLMLGPAGLLSYILLRAVLKRTATLLETPAASPSGA